MAKKPEPTVHYAFSSDDPEVIATWTAIFEQQQKASKLCRKAERDFAKEAGLAKGEKAEMVVRTGFGDDVPIGFRWYSNDKPAAWVWWKKNSVIQPRADKTGDAWRARFNEIRQLYPKPRQVLHELFGVPQFVGLGLSPGLEMLGDTFWVFFGDKGTSQWDGGEKFTPRKLSEYYAAKEAEETVA